MIGKGLKWLRERGAAPAAPTAAEPSVRVLMVCTGNICRSPTAEAVLRKKLAAAGVGGVTVDSAGTHGYHTGEAPDARAVKHGALRGYDLGGLKARPVVPADFQRHALMLALDESHLDWLRRKVPPGYPGRLELLMAYSTRYAAQREVPDPYYGPPAGFEQVLDLVEDACDGLVAALARSVPAR